MKRILLFPFLLIFTFNLFGQYNSQLIDTTKHWSTVDEYTAGGGIPYSFYNKFSEDTLIGNVNYYKVYSSYDEFMTEWELTGFIRDNNDKVYLRNLNNDEGLIYDFGAQIDDTIHINNNLSWWSGWQLDVVVSGIDSIYIEPAGEYRKSILVREAAFPNPLYETWIEGIGSEAGVLFSGFKIMGATGTVYSLQCYFENQEIIYKNPFHSICFYPTVGTPEINQLKNNIQLFPNPVKGISHLIIDDPNHNSLTIRIYNSTGIFIEQHKVVSPTRIKINSNNYPKGMYFYQVFESNKLIINEKFIVL